MKMAIDTKVFSLVVAMVVFFKLPSKAWTQECQCNPVVHCDPKTNDKSELWAMCKDVSTMVLNAQQLKFEQFIEEGRSPAECDCNDICRVKYPVDCQDIQKSNPEANSGVYTIFPLGSKTGFPVSCDMETGTGGWTVFQRRENGKVDFYRGWNDYKTGFGNMTSEFWLGLDKINQIVSQDQYELLINMEERSVGKRYALYKKFFIGPEQTDYMLFVGEYVGDAGNAFMQVTYGQNEMRFSTRDNDNDKSSDNCAVSFQGAWWYKACHYSNLNGLYGAGGNQGPVWQSLAGPTPLQFVEMKIRRIL